MLVKNTLEYNDQEVILEGYYAYDDTSSQRRPLVLIAHDWSGRNDFAEQKAEQLASLGFVGFAIDMYGKGKLGQTDEEKKAFMSPLTQERKLLQQRINAALIAAKQLAQVDQTKIAAIGYCFGGLCVLDLARSGADILGVVSLHGLLIPPNHKNLDIKAKILALHGHDDPMVKPDQVLAFETEMTESNVDWQVHTYSQTTHGFANPHANNPVLGTLYNPRSDKRSWLATMNFLNEIFDRV